MRGSVLLQIVPQIALVMGFSLVVVVCHASRPDLVPVFNGAPLALIGIALSVFMGFRNTACYERWWEGRRQIGALVGITRQFGRQTLILGDADLPARRQLVGLTIAFTQALVPHLRQGAGIDKVQACLSVSEQAIHARSRNPPDALLRLISEELAALYKTGCISDIAFQLMDRSVGEMAGVQAACERILTTPIPFVYRLLLYRTTYVFCLMFPFGYANTLAWGTPLVVGLVAYAFFGLDALADQLETPFGTHGNGLPIAALADTVEINLREALAETDLPPLPMPFDDELL